MRRGSSPLARGLLRRARCQDVCCGIIPARAGFTYAPPLLLRTPGDHPRSRGVYHGDHLHVFGSWGSSPLARSLPAHRRRFRQRRGIIPARAGFTHRRRPPADGARDHPRSRGVYPLAPLLPTPTAWIIPARAGFTRGRRRLPASGGDHPRSRGVYENCPYSTISMSGSSSLARGLPPQKSP